MGDLHVDGRTQLTISTGGTINELHTGDLHVTVARDLNSLLILSHLDVGSLRIDEPERPVKTKVRELYIENSKIANSMEVSDLDIDNLRVISTTAGELILLNTAILHDYNLSFTTVNSFEWAMGHGTHFPPDAKLNDLTRFTFTNLKITTADVIKELPSGSEDTEIAKMSKEMLANSIYSISAYDSLNKFWASRGDPEADEVFLAGHKAKCSRLGIFARSLDWV
jgi:hypothetical protein